MSKITSVQGFAVRYNLPPEHQVAWKGGRITETHYVFVKITSGEGRTGWGEIAGVYFAPEIYTHIINNKVKDFLVGKDAENITRIHQELHTFLISLGYSGLAKAVISGVDIALHNLHCKPSHRAIKVRAYASTGFNQDTDRLCDQCTRAVESGFQNIKIRGGFSVAEDIARIRAARRCLGSSIGLMLELSQPYASPRYAFSEVLRICEEIAEFDVLFVEEPFWPDDIDNYKKLAERTVVKIACGENLYTDEQFKSFGPIVDVCQPDIGRMGGITSLARISKYCKAVAPHQFANSVALYTLCRNVEKVQHLYMVEIDLLPNPLRDIVFGGAVRVVDGALVARDDGIPADLVAMAEKTPCQVSR